MNTAAIPSLRRRLACMTYEAMLLFGVVAVSGTLFAVLLEQRHALYLRHALQGWLFVVLTIYFVWFWTHGGQTLAMKTWQLKLLTKDGRELRFGRAVLRYVLAWLWLLPGLGVAWALGAQQWLMVIIPAINFFIWAFAVYLDPERQFLHDRLAGTRIVRVQEAARQG